MRKTLFAAVLLSFPLYAGAQTMQPRRIQGSTVSPVAIR